MKAESYGKLSGKELMPSNCGAEKSLGLQGDKTSQS